MIIENIFGTLLFPLFFHSFYVNMIFLFLTLLIMLFVISIGSEVSRAVCPDTNQCRQSESGYYCKDQFCPPFCDGCYAMFCGQDGVWERRSVSALYQVPPRVFHYKQDVYYLYTEYSVNLTPVIDCYDCVYMITPGSSLPNGLYISENGILRGKIDDVLTNFTFSVTAYNMWGSANCTVSLTVSKYSVDSRLLPSATIFSFIFPFVFGFLSIQFAITVALSVLLFVEVTVLFHIKQEKRQLQTVYV